MDYAAEKDLGIIVHAGEDVGLPETVHCTPERILNLWKHIQPEKLILAHMGGWKMWDEVEEKLLGLPFYLDTAVVLNPIFPFKLENEQFVRMVRKHGADLADGCLQLCRSLCPLVELFRQLHLP